MISARRARSVLVGALLAVTLMSACDGTAEGGLMRRSATAADDPAKGTAAPNILLVMVDDMRADDFAYLPRVQRMVAARGTSVRRFYAHNPLCCPARATTLTGQYSHNHRVLTNDIDQHGGFHHFDDSQTLATWIDDYRTALIGRYLSVYGSRGSEHYVPPAWDQWKAGIYHSAFNYSGSRVNVDGRVRQLHAYMTTWYGDQMIRFVRGSRRPFFLHATFVAPHAGQPRNPDDPELVSTPSPPSVDGVNLLPHLTSGEVLPHRPILLEAWDSIGGPYHGVVTSQRWKLVDYKNGPVELYDLQRDPQELRNLAANPRWVDKRRPADPAPRPLSRLRGKQLPVASTEPSGNLLVPAGISGLSGSAPCTR